MLRFTRFWLPLVVILGGIVAIALGRNIDAFEGGALIISAGLSIWLLNLLHRIGVSGDRERGAEDDARAFFDAHGHWPDEPAPPGREREPRPSPHRSGGPPPRRVRAAPRRRGSADR